MMRLKPSGKKVHPSWVHKERKHGASGKRGLRVQNNREPWGKGQVSTREEQKTE